MRGGGAGDNGDIYYHGVPVYNRFTLSFFLIFLR